MQQLSKTGRRTKGLLLLTLVIAGAILIASATLVSRNTAEVQRILQGFDAMSSEKTQHLLDINASLGYGGLIHNLKNLLLRRDEKYLNRFHEELGKSLMTIKHYQELPLSEIEKTALQQLENTLLLYRQRVDGNSRLFFSNIPAEQLIPQILIDDTPAVNAIEQLSKEQLRNDSNKHGNNKKYMLGRIRAELGYNAMIHQYKDFILEGDRLQLLATNRHIENANNLIQNYQNLSLNDIELQSLNVISATIRQYQQALKKIDALHNKGTSLEDIDAQVYVNDAPAFDSLTVLEHHISRDNKTKAEDVNQRLGDIHSLAESGVVISTLAIVILLIMSLWSSRSDKRYESNLEQAQRRLSAILDNTADAIIVSNKVGLITEFNVAAEKMFGYTSAEAIGKNVSLLMPNNHAQNHNRYMQKYNVLGVAKIIGIGRETVAVTKGGAEFPIFLSIGKSMVDGEIAFTGIIRDISKEKQIQEELITAKDDAEQANSAKSRFLASMSHELRTPLNAVIGLSQLLVTDPKNTLNDEQQESLGDIQHSGRHLLSLVNDILDYSKMENEKLTLDIATLNPYDSLHSAITMARPQAAAKNIDICISDSCKNLPDVKADARRIRQIMLNFLSNAVKYNYDNGRIDIHCETINNRYLRISVNDTGRGIDDIHKDDVFVAFKRLGAEGGSIEGTGIGLSITKTLVEQMNGNIGYESVPKKGSSFWFELPLDIKIID
jgi:PAS domain S-box-containing protein